MPRRGGWIIALVGLIASCSIGNAATISFSGSFIFDDDVQFFQYSSPTAGIVTVNTASFAAGGFAPILALYDTSGVLLFTADGPATNDCSIAGPDSAGTIYCYDAKFEWNSIANSTYYVAVSQYDNFPINDIPATLDISMWNSATTFSEYGNHFFSGGDPFGPGCPPQLGFCLNDGTPRSPNWTVQFTGPSGLIATPIPETSPVLLMLGGLAIVFGKLLRRQSRRAGSVRPLAKGELNVGN
jgi:hypothetical protein